MKDYLKKNTLALSLYYRYKKMLGIFRYKKHYAQFKKLLKDSRGFEIKNDRMILRENTSTTHFDTHYIYHPAWAARILKKTQPQSHTDISSTLSFSSIVSAFIPIEFYDYRPAHIFLSNLASKKADLLNLPFADKSISSLSCLHTVEHIGLGRYGDPINPDGDLKAISELKRVLAQNGNLLFAVPIGRAKISFNAHRVYSHDQIMSYFSDLTLQEFSLIPDNALETGIISKGTKELSDMQVYGCGLFWFIKK